MSITTEEIKNVVLVEDDFGHEMRVGNILTNPTYPPVHYAQARVMAPRHGGTYKDQVTGKTRQFDYRCQISRNYRSPVNIFLAVECKNLNPDFPVVVCGRQRTREESCHLFIEIGHDGKSQSKIVEGANSFYKPNSFVGKSLLRLRKKDNRLCADGDSEVYDRWSQAVASSHDLAFAAANNKSSHPYFAFVMPVVVVPDNSLWIVTYNDDGLIAGDPIQVNQSDFYIDHKLLIGLPFALTHIHFVTLKGLSELVSTFANADAYQWDQIFNHASSDFAPA